MKTLSLFGARASIAAAGADTQPRSGQSRGFTAANGRSATVPTWMLLLVLALFPSLARAATPAFTDFYTNQFGVAGHLVTIKPGGVGEFATDAGSTDTYVATLSPAITAYVIGGHYRFKAGTANTGPATLNLNGVGAVTIVKASGGITTALADNDIRAGQWVDVVYDGTNFQMQSTLGNTASTTSGIGATNISGVISAAVAAGSGVALSTNGNTITFSAPGAFAADAGSTDAYVATLSPAITSYATGGHYGFKANTANTGAATLNLNGVGAVTLVKVIGGITTALVDNDIRAGQWVDVVYDGTNFQVQSTLGNVGATPPVGTMVESGITTQYRVPQTSSTAGTNFMVSGFVGEANGTNMNTLGKLTADTMVATNGFTGSQILLNGTGATAWTMYDSAQTHSMTFNPAATIVTNLNGTFPDRPLPGFWFNVMGSGGTNFTTFFTNTIPTSYLPARTLQSLKFSFPRRVDGTGCLYINTTDTTTNTFMVPRFSGTAETNGNFCRFGVRVPRYFDTSIVPTANLSIRHSAADTAAKIFNIGFASVANSAVSMATVGTWIKLDIASDASGAYDDLESVQDVALTGWNSGLTAGQWWVIELNRAGVTDASTVAADLFELEIIYGVTQ